MSKPAFETCHQVGPKPDRSPTAVVCLTLQPYLLPNPNPQIRVHTIVFGSDGKPPSLTRESRNRQFRVQSQTRNILPKLASIDLRVSIAYQSIRLLAQLKLAGRFRDPRIQTCRKMHHAQGCQNESETDLWHPASVRPLTAANVRNSASRPEEHVITSRNRPPIQQENQNAA